MSPKPHSQHWRNKLYKIIFFSDTPGGKFFDIVLIVCIIVSVIAVILDSVGVIASRYGYALYIVEWFFTVIFTIEYILRLVSARRPLKYVFSFFGIVDLLTVIPTYLDLIFPGTRFLLVIRILRVLRIFRVLKLSRYVGEMNTLLLALKTSSRKIMVFLLAIISIVVILGSLMYLIEGAEHGFTSIPVSIYWAIVTLTTVGYGDISPKTPLGQGLSVIVMILGYSIIAVPTGIFSVELTRAYKSRLENRSCPECGSQGHDEDAKHCKYCGKEL
ncbi:MAG: ion transporter [Thermodesulfobacteriota bacterium]